MQLQRIYNSKLYLTNPRKDRIHAAIGNPINAPLVQQLSSYLDNNSKQKLKEAIQEEAESIEKANENTQEHEPEENPDVNQGFPNEEHNVFSPSYGGGSSFDDFGDDFGDEDMGGEEPDIFAEPEGGDIDVDSNPAPASDDTALTESTKVNGQAITADTSIEDMIVGLANEIPVIKGTLNGMADTAGVLRISLDNNELWIYYKDEVNIGDIMVNVIEVLNGANYTYLTFSRLARSNNAIVFDINMTLSEPMKTIKEVQEEK